MSGQVKSKDKNGLFFHHEVYGPFFWLGKRSVAEIHAAAAAKLHLKVEDTVMNVQSEGRPVNLDVYLSMRPPIYRLRRMWDLSQVADVIDLSPAPTPGLHSPLLLTPLILAFCYRSVYNVLQCAIASSDHSNKLAMQLISAEGYAEMALIGSCLPGHCAQQAACHSRCKQTPP